MSDWPAEAGRIPTDATTAKFVTEVFSSKVINHVRSNLVAVAVCNTTWKEQLAKGNMLYIPVMSTYTASDVDVTTSLITTQAAVTNAAWGETAEELTIAYWKECPVMIDDSTALQTNVPNLLDIAAGNAAYALEAAIDTTVNTLFQSLTSDWAGSDGQTFSDDILINLMEGLDEADVPRRDRALVVDPSVVADVYKIDKFMSYDYSKTVFTTDAYIGKVNTYNLPMFVSNNLSNTTTGAYGALLHRDAIGVAIQSDPKVEKWREPSLHSDVINVSAIYGADVLRSTFGAYFYTRKK
jgi:hypothetical protein